jgi:transposase-like protein
MARLTKVKRCPRCGHGNAIRRQRKLWHRIFTNSGLYRCKRCQEEYLVLGCCAKRPRMSQA